MRTLGRLGALEDDLRGGWDEATRRAVEAAEGTPRETPERPLPKGARPIGLGEAEETMRIRPEMFPPEAQEEILNAAEQVDWARTQRRGVIPDAVAAKMAEDWASDNSLDKVIAQGTAGKAYNTEELRALRNATGSQGIRVADLAEAVSQGADDSTTLQAFWNEAEKLQRLVTIAEGGKAEWGRSGRALQDPARLINLAPNDAVTQMIKLLGGDRERIVKAITDYKALVDSGAGPVQQAHFWAELKNPPLSLKNPRDYEEWLKALRYNSMLSGPRTAEINTISFLSEIPWRLARDAASSAIRGKPQEMGPELRGLVAGLGRANQAFMETWTSGVTREQALRGDLPKGLATRVRNPVGKALATGLDAPGRVLNSADQWATALAQNMAVGRRAGQVASREGLKGKAWDTRVAELISDPNIMPAIHKEANEIAERMVFKGDMGGMGKLMSQASEMPILGNLLLPFVRTVYHITSRGVERSPVGLAGTVFDVARGKYGYGSDLKQALSASKAPGGVTPLGERLGDNLMGSAIWYGFYQQALQGNISGAGPEQAADRELLRSQGWTPYSIKVGDKWVSYANWGPVAIPLSMAAAAAETQRFGKPGADTKDMVIDGVRRTTQVASEQTYLQGLGAVYKGLTEPERYGSSALHNYITSLIPYGSALNTVGQALDPYARKVERFNPEQAIQARLPGYREEVPEDLDVLGRPKPNIRYGLGAANPLAVSQASDDPVLRELEQLGVTIAPPPKTATVGRVPIELTTQEQRDLQIASGELAAQALSNVMASPDYQSRDDATKALILERIIAATRESARNQFLAAMDREELLRRRAQGELEMQRIPVGGR